MKTSIHRASARYIHRELPDFRKTGEKKTSCRLKQTPQHLPNQYRLLGLMIDGDKVMRGQNLIDLSSLIYHGMPF